jgi:hypothetical protein
MKKLFFCVFVVSGLLFAGCDIDPNATYTVWYYANGADYGNAPTDNNKYKSGDEAVVLGQWTLLKTGFKFQHWNTKADNSGDEYIEDDKLKINNRTVFLYAIWKRND